METKIDPCLQEDKLTTRSIEELIEVQVDPNEPSRVVKIDKGLQGELAQQFTSSFARIKTCLHGHMQTW